MMIMLISLDTLFVKTKGEEISSELIKTLLGELQASISREGLKNSISYCSERAIPLTDSLSNSYGVKIKRTSFKFRNPKNKPDKMEEGALKFFESAVKRGKKVDYILQTFKRGNKKVYRYYKPIFVAPLCLNCHGKENKNIPDEVLQEILRRYPKDKARGYSEGDFRGVIRVEFEE
jgi:Protein of unknown function (DUF3365).